MTIDEVKLVHPQPGDTVILRLKERLDTQKRAAVIKKFAEFFPGCQVLVFDTDADIEIVKE